MTKTQIFNSKPMYMLTWLACSATDLLMQKGGVDKALSAIAESEGLSQELDPKLAKNFLTSRYIHAFTGNIVEAEKALRRHYDYFRSKNDLQGQVYSLDMMKDFYGIVGDWQRASSTEAEALDLLEAIPTNLFLRARIQGHNIWHKIWGGRYRASETGIRYALAVAENEEQAEAFPGLHRDLGLVLGLQRRWAEAEQHLERSLTEYNWRSRSDAAAGSTLGFYGAVLSLQRKHDKAEEYMKESVARKGELGDFSGIPEVLVWLGRSWEARAKEAQDSAQREHLSEL